jgi:hypothetical protein
MYETLQQARRVLVRPAVVLEMEHGESAQIG